MFAVKQPTILAVGLTNGAQQTPGSDAETGQVCIANINASGRRRRLIISLIVFGVGLAVLAVMMLAGVDHRWRLGLFFIFAGAATSFFEWHDKTCIILAAKNLLEVGAEVEKIHDAAVQAQIRRQAIRLQAKAILTGVILTLITLLLP